jgi:hypothetical protein
MIESVCRSTVSFNICKRSLIQSRSCDKKATPGHSHLLRTALLLFRGRAARAHTAARGAPPRHLEASMLLLRPPAAAAPAVSLWVAPLLLEPYEFLYATQGGYLYRFGNRVVARSLVSQLETVWGSKKLLRS